MSSPFGRLNNNLSDLPNLAGLDSLRSAAAHKDPAAVASTATRFESLLAQEMIKSMRQASGKDSMFPGQSQTYRDLYDREIANRLSQGKGLGLQPMLRKALGGAANAAAAPARNGAAPAQAKPMSLARYLRAMPAQEASAAPPSPDAAVGAGISPAAAAAGVNHSSNAVAYRLPTVTVTAAVTGSTSLSGSGRRAVPLGDGPPISPSSGAPNRHFSADDFVAKVWPHAQRAAAQLGVAPEALVAQAALESGWGKSVGGDNNLFGIKAGSGWHGAVRTLQTSEYRDGRMQRESAAFRSYASIGDSFDDYAKLLKSNPRYAAALGAGSDTARFAGALQKAGYATDPNYAAKIASIARTPMIAQALQKLESGPLLANR